jgi:hypothetical protein
MKGKTKAGGMMHKPMLKPGESKTARPAKGKVMSKPDETRKRMMQSPGMSRYERGPKGKPA